MFISSYAPSMIVNVSTLSAYKMLFLIFRINLLEINYKYFSYVHYEGTRFKYFDNFNLKFYLIDFEISH